MIRSIDPARRLDSRGCPTVQVELRTEKGEKPLSYLSQIDLPHTKTGTFRAIVPSGASTGTNKAVEVRDGDESAYGGRGVQEAVSNIQNVIGHNLLESDFRVDTDQRKIDQFLKDLGGTKNKERLGANAILGVSMACARACAAHSVSGIFEFNSPMDGRHPILPFLGDPFVRIPETLTSDVF
jgi:enolase